jgi:hypothetical protein
METQWNVFRLSNYPQNGFKIHRPAVSIQLSLKQWTEEKIDSTEMAQPYIVGSTWSEFRITKICSKALHVNLSWLSSVTASCFREAVRNKSSYSKHGMDRCDETTKIYTGMYGSGRNGARILTYHKS